MIKEDYEPEELEFVLPEAVKETFPLELEFEGCESDKEILQQINEHFNAMFPENETALRLMDETEKNDIRHSYCKLVEEKMPVVELGIIEAKEQAKRIKDEAEARYQAIKKQISDFAAKVKEGTKEKALPSTKTFRIALNGYYLYYAILDGKVVLAKAEKVSSYDKSSLWSQEDKNREAMMELFGLEFPEVEKPDDDDQEHEEDLSHGELDNSDVMGEDDFEKMLNE